MINKCGKSHDQHLAEWQSWRDDCDVCGFGMQDLDQCERLHPDDGVTWCGACGFDADAEGLRPGELTVIAAAARAAGVDPSREWTIGQTVRWYRAQLVDMAIV